MRPRSQRERWNQRHADAELRPPATWVIDHADLITAQPRGRALDVPCGLGRHALWLAEQGFDVDALDFSDVAVARVTEEAERRRLPIAAHRVDLEASARFPRAPYDVVVHTYFLERSLLPALAAALAPGGLLVFETFTRGQAEEPWGPSSPDFLLEPGELLRAFAALEVLDHREGTSTEPGGRRRHVASLVARARRPDSVTNSS